MRVQITADGIITIEQVEAVKKAVAKHVDSLKEKRKYRKRRPGIVTTCDICNKVFSSKAGCSIHKHYSHPTKFTA